MAQCWVAVLSHIATSPAVQRDGAQNRDLRVSVNEGDVGVAEAYRKVFLSGIVEMPLAPKEDHFVF
jgi:hypothetical protein